MNKKGLILFISVIMMTFMLGMNSNHSQVHSKEKLAKVHTKHKSVKQKDKNSQTEIQLEDLRMNKLKEESRKQQHQTLSKHTTKVLLNAPLIKQMPELPRGCEVTSLAMLLQFSGVHVTKMALAEKIKKDPTPFSKEDGEVYFGNPNTGFVGDIYSFKKPGYGVYHSPVAILARHYMGKQIIDLTGQSFQAVLDELAEGEPVWVINNTHFAPLPKKYWETWETPEEPVKISYQEHSVLVTGYDKKYIYFNDPLAGIKNRKVDRHSFIDAWNQFGNQAISIRV